MKRPNSFKPARLAFVAACTMLCAVTSQAGTLSFEVDINTSPLLNNLNGPFSLDFQLNPGTGAATNTVNLTNFAFTAGSATGSPSLSGNATGSLGSSVSLSDASDTFSEFYQGFAATTTHISFDASVTENVDPTTPDAFVMAILDKNLFNIPTTGLGDSLLLLNINASNLSLANVQTFSSTSPDAGATVTASPEPGTLGMGLAAGLIALGWRARRRTALKKN